MDWCICGKNSDWNSIVVSIFTTEFQSDFCVKAQNYELACWKHLIATCSSAIYTTLYIFQYIALFGTFRIPVQFLCHYEQYFGSNRVEIAEHQTTDEVTNTITLSSGDDVVPLLYTSVGENTILLSKIRYLEYWGSDKTPPKPKQIF